MNYLQESIEKLILDINNYTDDATSWRKRRDALRPLGQIGTPEAITTICKTLEKDPNSSVRVRAAVVLGETKRIEAISSLCNALEKDWDSGVRSYAISSLLEINRSSEKVISALEKAEKFDNREKVRIEAHQAIQKLKEQILINK